MKSLLVIISIFIIGNSYSQLAADFSATPLNVCIGDEITFTDESTIGGSVIEFWTWDFGDGTVSH